METDPLAITVGMRVQRRPNSPTLSWGDDLVPHNLPAIVTRISHGTAVLVFTAETIVIVRETDLNPRVFSVIDQQVVFSELLAAITIAGLNLLIDNLTGQSLSVAMSTRLRRNGRPMPLRDDDIPYDVILTVQTLRESENPASPGDYVEAVVHTPTGDTRKIPRNLLTDHYFELVD
jgi:hypothetical protein